MSKIAKMAVSLAFVSVLTVAGSAGAAPINSPVPTNTYITFGALDWTWASPCSPTGCVNGINPLDLSYQGTQGWRLPTLAELLAGPAPSDFIFSGGNVPFGGASVDGTIFFGAPGTGACATAYFTNATYNECDYNDAVIGGIYGLANQYAGEPNVETWLVRSAVPVPEPITMTIFGVGLVGAAAMRRRQKKSV